MMNECDQTPYVFLLERESKHDDAYWHRHRLSIYDMTCGLLVNVSPFWESQFQSRGFRKVKYVSWGNSSEIHPHAEVENETERRVIRHVISKTFSNSMNVFVSLASNKRNKNNLGDFACKTWNAHLYRDRANESFCLCRDKNIPIAWGLVISTYSTYVAVINVKKSQIF